MRIRTIKPDIWRSEDFTSLSDFGQLVFIGLINYVDDNGVGRFSLIDFAADVFASRLADNPTELLPKITEVFGNLSERGMIQIYEADYMGKKAKFVYLTNWDRHQRISHPMKPRFPRPFNDSEDLRKSSAVYGNLPVGRGEEGKKGRGRVEEGKSLETDESKNLNDTFSKLHSDDESDDEIVDVEIIDESDLNKSKKPAPRESTPHLIPADWKPNTQSRRLAAQLGLDCDEVARKFRVWATNHAIKVLDFDLEFDEWLRRERTPSRPESRAKANRQANAELRQRIAQKEKEFMERNGYAAN